MSGISHIVAGLEAKVKKLIESHQSKVKEIEDLRTKNLELAEVINTQKTEINRLIDQNKMIKLAKSIEKGDGSATELKLKINEVIREVDKCIGMLNK